MDILTLPCLFGAPKRQETDKKASVRLGDNYQQNSYFHKSDRDIWDTSAVVKTAAEASNVIATLNNYKGSTPFLWRFSPEDSLKAYTCKQFIVQKLAPETYTVKMTLQEYRGTGTAANDPDAIAFCDAIGTLDTEQQLAIENLVISLKANGTWNKYTAVYPFVGGTANSHKYNLKNPLDTNAAYRLTFVGNAYHGSDGYRNIDANAAAGVTGANTNLIPSVASIITNCSFAVGVRGNVGVAAFDLRASGANGEIVNIHAKWSDNSAYADIGSVAGGRTSAASNGGLVQCSRIGTSNTIVTGVGSAISVGTATLLPNDPIYFGWNNSGLYATQVINFGAIGVGLTRQEMDADRVIINRYQTALGRS